MSIRATYRLQFHKDFRFEDAARHAAYFASLGVSHIYASPVLKARAGSTHGYDVVDHTIINPELGGEKAFESMAMAFRQHGLGLIVDIVPNHMAVGDADNALWLDLLENGPASRYARFFDVDFETQDVRLTNKVLAPFLGDQYGIVLKSGDLKVIYDDTLQKAAVAYHHHRFPIRPEDQASVRRDLTAFSAPDVLHHLLEQQNFRLAWWGSAGDAINWRRFFDIIDLAGVRVEDDTVFDHVHAKTLDLYARGLIDGVRVDHVDGLADPAAYCVKLRRELAALDNLRPDWAGPPPAYVVIEKILSAGEDLPQSWPVDGTTGYDFMNQISALQHDPGGERHLSALWHVTSGRPGDFEPEELMARREILTVSFDGQLHSVADALARHASLRAETRDLTVASLRRALIAIIQHLRVYRTYATGRAGSPPLGEAIGHAIAVARTLPFAESEALDFITQILKSVGVEDLVRRFNQLTAPVTAKSVEDTAFYRYGRLLSRNDVGFDPREFSMSAAEFHAAMERRSAHSPRAMLATATHDHKRGEDVRARLAILSEDPERWRTAVQTWTAMNAGIRPAAVEAGDEYQLYQTLVGCWPLGLQLSDAKGLTDFRDRVWHWFEKALREAKGRTSWASPNAEFETANQEFLTAILAPAAASSFLPALAAYADRIAPAGAANGLVQTVLRNTVPGVPDLYQGTEFWDLSLVDPDNRRPVDYEAREAALLLSRPATALAGTWQDGRVKQAIIAAVLAWRAQSPQLFLEGAYQPLAVTGSRAAHVIAFARRHGNQQAIVVAALHCANATIEADALSPPPGWWGDTCVACAAEGSFKNVLGDESVMKGGQLAISSLLRDLPVAVLRLV